MSFTSVPFIVVCCYVIGEIIKFIFRNKQETYKIIPIVVTSIGGLLGILIYLTNPEIIFNVDSIWSSLLIGMVSGSSATGANQIVKQLIKKDDLYEWVY